MVTGASGALTTTLTLTIRKFVSLVISIIYFRNPFTLPHWAGSILVFLGGIVYIYGSSSKVKRE
jgi:UDP-xylose/UDP-N-acetylglucosamine transporter B4